MEIKNKFVFTGLIAGLAIFGSTVSSAAQTCQETPGELHEIKVDGRASSRRSPGFNDAIISRIKEENLIRLDERAKMTCSGRKFCIEGASIKSDVDEEEFFVTMIVVQTSAVVNCLK